MTKLRISVYSRTSTHRNLSTTATSLRRPLFLADSPYIDSCLNLSMKAKSLVERFKCNLTVSKITVRSCRTKIKSNDLPLVTCNPVQPVSGLDDRRLIPPPFIAPQPPPPGRAGSVWKEDPR